MLHRYAHIDSTNRVAKELVADGAATGTVVLSAAQSAGKGQYGRSFESPLGGLYFSLILRPDLSLEDLPLITLATGVGCMLELRQSFDLSPEIKWPNDIYLSGKKVAGILCENVIQTGPSGPVATVIIGVGINVNCKRSDFAPELQPIVTTLYEHLHVVTNLDALLDRLILAIGDQITRLRDDSQGVLADWQQADYLCDQPVVYVRNGLRLIGTGRGITARGLYRIRDHEGCEHQVIGGQLRPGCA